MNISFEVIRHSSETESKIVPDSPYAPGAWSLNGILLRDDGTTEWWQDGELHREDGPAIEFPDGTKMWFTKGKLHRDDGPAVERGNGLKRWWRHGKPVLNRAIEESGRAL